MQWATLQHKPLTIHDMKLSFKILAGILLVSNILGFGQIPNTTIPCLNNLGNDQPIGPPEDQDEIIPIADGSSQNFDCLCDNSNPPLGLQTAYYVFNIAEAPCNPYFSAFATIPFGFELWGPYSGLLGSESYEQDPFLINSSLENSTNQSIAMVNLAQGHYILKVMMEVCNQTITFNFGGNCFDWPDDDNIVDTDSNGDNDDDGTNSISVTDPDQDPETICDGCVDYLPADENNTAPDCPNCFSSDTDPCGSPAWPPVYNAPCTECLPDFSPNIGKYVFSCWVKEEGVSLNITNYVQPKVLVSIFPDFENENGYTLVPEGPIIDGWQKIEKEFDIPANQTSLKFILGCGEGNNSNACYFDDIRIFPYDASLKSYVYDPKTLRFIAELDERNFATLYEYDEEGKLIRVKKETERGIMTIQENRNNTFKQ
jgi:hypothetical protein